MSFNIWLSKHQEILTNCGRKSHFLNSLVGNPICNEIMRGPIFSAFQGNSGNKKFLGILWSGFWVLIKIETLEEIKQGYAQLSRS